MRGTGLADGLLTQLVGDRDATLWVVEGNARARRFYTRLGFVVEGARTEHDATGTPEIRMVRRAVAGPWTQPRSAEPESGRASRTGSAGTTL